MRRQGNQEGFALIVLIGITAALAILAAALVMMLSNQQHMTSKDRASKTSLYYAEAALNSGAAALENDNSWLTAAYTNTTAMNTNYGTIAGAPTATYAVYDNGTPINTAVNYDANGDGEVWVQTTTTFNNKTTIVRELVSSSTKTSILPKAAAYADTDIVLNGTSNIYGVQLDGTPDTSGAPYVTTIMAGSDFTANTSTTLASPADSTHTQSLGLQVNGTVTTPGHNFSPASGGVGLLSDYFDQAHQAALMAEAQSGMPTQANPVGTAISTTLYTTLKSTSGQTYNAATDLVMPTSNNSGNMVLSSAAGKTSVFNFKSLYVTGSLTISGNTTVNCSNLYVGGDLTVDGCTTANVTDKFGATYVTGKADFDGPTGTYGAYRLGIQTTTTSSTQPGPFFAKILSVDGNLSADNSSYDGSSGAYDLVLGPTWIDGDAGTGDVAVNFSAPTTGVTSSNCPTVMCPLLATTEQTHSNGYINFGSLTAPMVYFMQCDNDNLYSNTCQWANVGNYFGLMILFEAPIVISGSTDGTHPNITGAVLEGCPTATDITMSGNSSICYNQTVINNCTSDSLHTTTTGVVAGSWQQLTAY